MSAVRARKSIETATQAAVRVLDETGTGLAAADLYFELLAHDRKQGCIAAIAQMALGPMPVEQLMHFASEMAAAALEAEFAQVAELQQEEDHLLVTACSGWRRNVAGREILEAGDRSQPGYALMEKAPVIVTDVCLETRFKASCLLHEHGVRSGISVPISADDAPIGALSVFSRTPSRFTIRDAAFLDAVAVTLGAAIARKKRDHEEKRQNVERLTSLHSIECAIAASFELRTTLGLVLEEVSQQLSVDAAQVLLLSKDGQTLESAACLGFRNTTQVGREIHAAVSLAGEVVAARRSIQVQVLTNEKGQLFESHLGQGEGFVSYCAVPLITSGMVKGVLEVFHRTELTVRKDWLEFLETLGRQAAIAIDNACMYEEVQRSNNELAAAYDTTLEGWSRALDLRDHETQGHTQRVTEVTLELARKLGVPENQMIHIRRGCLLHDIGKMGIPDGILLKPGPLTEDERRLMEMHTVYAEDLLKPIPFLAPAMEIPASHHEKWDGTGYPRGLRGEDIPLAARIFAVVDVWDALSKDRPYRKAWPADQVRDYIAINSGKHFDPVIANEMLNLLNKQPFGQRSTRRGRQRESHG